MQNQTRPGRNLFFDATHCLRQILLEDHAKEKGPGDIRGLDRGSNNSEASPISILPLLGRLPN